MLVLDAEGGTDWHKLREDVALRLSLLGDQLVMASEPLDAATWGMSPEAVAAQARLTRGGGPAG